MIPSAFDEETGVLHGPPGTPAEDVSPLSVYQGPFDTGNFQIPSVISCWRPTPEELAEITRTRRVWIVIQGRTMPPLLPLGISPFLNAKTPQEFKGASAEDAAGGGI